MLKIILVLLLTTNCTYKWGYPTEDAGPDAGVDAGQREENE